MDASVFFQGLESNGLTVFAQIEIEVTRPDHEQFFLKNFFHSLTPPSIIASFSTMMKLCELVFSAFETV